MEFKSSLHGDRVIWRLKKRLYGLADAPRGWYLRVEEELTGLGCEKSKLDPALFLYRVKGTIRGMVAVWVDDFLLAGNVEFYRKVPTVLKKVFVLGESERRDFTYVGWQIQQNKNGSIIVHQNNFLRSIEEMDKLPQNKYTKQEELDEELQSKYRGAVGAINWLATNTRPDVSFEVMALSCKFGKVTLQDFNRIARLQTKVKEQPLSLIYRRLGDPEQLTVVVYGDAAHASLHDGVSSVRGKLVLLVGEDGKCSPLAWGSNKMTRVVRSPLAAETLAMADAVEEGFHCKTMIENIYGLIQGSINMAVITDSQSLQKAMNSCSVIKDRRCAIDLAALREGQDKGEFKVAWQAGADMLADSLTKPGPSKENLRTTINQGECGLIFK